MKSAAGLQTGTPRPAEAGGELQDRVPAERHDVVLALATRGHQHDRPRLEIATDLADREVELWRMLHACQVSYCKDCNDWKSSALEDERAAWKLAAN
jgi:hypothetical protein